MRVFLAILAQTIRVILEIGVRLSFALLIALLVIISIATALARNEDFTRLLLQDVVPKVVPELSFGESHGGLLSPVFSIEEIRYSDQAGSQLELKQLRLDWAPNSLWSKSLSINSLDIDSLDIVSAASESEDPAAAVVLPEVEIPIDIDVSALRIKRVTLHKAEISSEVPPLAEITDIFAAASARDSQLELEDLNGKLTQNDLKLSFQTEVSLNMTGSWDLDAVLAGDINGLPVEAAAPGLDSSLSYRVTLSESLQDLKFLAEVKNNNGGLKAEGEVSPLNASLPIQLQLSADSLQITSDEAEFSPSLNLQIAGDLDKGLEIRGMFDVAVNKPHLARYRIPSFVANLSQTQLRVEQLELVTQFADLPSQTTLITADANLIAPYAGKLQARSVGSKKLLADINGKWDGDSSHLPAVKAVLDIPNIGYWLPAASGGIKLNADLRNTKSGVPQLTALGKAEDIDVMSYRIKTADIKANLSVEESGSADLMLNGTGIFVDDMEIESLAISLSGTTVQHKLTAKVDSSIVKLQSSATGGVAFSDDGAITAWNGTFLDLAVQQQELGNLKLTEPAKISLAPNAADVKNLCLSLDKIDKASLCASGRVASDGQVAASLSQVKLPLASVAAFVDGLNASGELTGRGAVGGNLNAAETLSAELSLSVSEGGFSQADIAKKKDIPLFSFSRGEAGISYHEKNFHAEFQLDESNGGLLSVEAQSRFGIDSFNDAATIDAIPLQANLSATQLPIDWLRQGLPDVGELDGRLNAKLGLSGRVAEPVPTGEIEVSGTKLTVPAVGLSLKKWAVKVKPQGDNLYAELELLADDGGTLNAKLAGKLLADGMITGDVVGKDFPLYQTPDAQIWADPKLTIEYQADQLKVAGRVDVNKALIAPTISLKSSGSKISVSEDQVMVDEQGEAVEPSGGVGLNADVTIAFGSDVKINAYGLETSLGGKLQVIETPGRLTRARGEIKLVDGQYAAFGQPLKISRGALLFQNTLITQPALDVTAVREFDEVTVGVNARGTIETPELELFSTPALSQSDQLSWLVLGRPFDRKSSTQDSDNALARATRALQLQGAEFLTGKLSSKLGIENVSLESTDDGSGSALVLGKYLSPRLYLSYGLGLFDARNQMKLKYNIGRDWSFEAASDGIDSGGDILYEREK